MHLLSYALIEPHQPTPSTIDELVGFACVPQQWSIHQLAMAEQLYSDQFGRLSAPSQDWTPSSAVSSFNLPLIYDSTLTTPVSLNPDSPHPHGKHLNDAQWSRSEHPSMQYPQRSNDGIYSSLSMKSKNDPLSLPTSDADNMLAVSPYVFDSPSTPCPPTPYWGSFSVSAPQTTSAPTTTNTPGSNTRPSASMQPGTRNQAPILIAPIPTSRRPRQRSPDVPKQQQQQQNSQQQHSPQQHNQQQAQAAHRSHQQQMVIQPMATQIKRECSPPPVPAAEPKRRRRSAPPVEQRRPLSKDQLTEEDKLLFHLRDLKEEEKWDWKELTDRFNKETAGKHNLAALQMRYTRLVERMRVWTDVEIRALQRAKKQFENQKWKTIADCMLEYGCETKWSPHACRLKWQELNPSVDGETDSYYSGNWNDNTNLSTESSRMNDSNVSRDNGSNEGNDDSDDGVDDQLLVEQAQQQQRQRQQQQQYQLQGQKSGSSRSGSGSGRSSVAGMKKSYGKRQEWTVQHSDAHASSRRVH